MELNYIDKKEELDRIKDFFQDIRFYMGKSVLDGMMGQAYVDDFTNPKFAILMVRQYCFMSGNIEEKILKNLIDTNLKDKILIPSDNIKEMIEKIYKDKVIKGERYSIKKNPKFNINILKEYAQNISSEFIVKEIDLSLALRIKKENYINITDDYENYGIGYCCLYNDKIIGVASSNIFYKDGIEVNIKVSEEYRRRGTATALASKLILKCLNENKKISWDASNMNSVGLAAKLGFEYDSKYNIYKFVD